MYLCEIYWQYIKTSSTYIFLKYIGNLSGLAVLARHSLGTRSADEILKVSSTNGYGLSETSEIINGLFKFIEIFKWVLQFEVNLCISWVMFPVLSLELMILLIIILSHLLQVYVLLRLNLHTL